MEDILYVPGIGYNLLSIIALNRKGFEIQFRDQGVKIINTAIKGVVVREGVYNSLYQLKELTSNKVFLTGNIPLTNTLGATEEGQETSIFRRLYKRLDYPRAYRLKDLYLFVEGVGVVILPPYF